MRKKLEAVGGSGIGQCKEPSWVASAFTASRMGMDVMERGVFFPLMVMLSKGVSNAFIMGDRTRLVISICHEGTSGS